MAKTSKGNSVPPSGTDDKVIKTKKDFIFSIIKYYKNFDRKLCQIKKH
jgi:hypothetical protein